MSDVMCERDLTDLALIDPVIDIPPYCVLGVDRNSSDFFQGHIHISFYDRISPALVLISIAVLKIQTASVLYITCLIIEISIDILDTL